ncbi:hypothetical protein SSZBM1_202 [Synechococcus phage S-SZBM1]|uniref:Uncharacterized protein n=1 Tax=Synechococcus phage S-SZBM1 TaxID=2926475 RepID=A0AC61TSX2_9CAUD|nr:hypothetical protein PP650_gp074 [Synechococcus phage S-SZBM1]UNH61319.1 hypothetical protein SSZBM1_202 [Synechococcus phage S-SZBM1]
MSLNRPNDLIPVEGDETLYRDSKSNAIIMNDDNAYDKYMQSYLSRQKSKEHMSSLQNQIDGIKSDMNQIKDLLSQLVNKEKN